jgi:DNA-binding MarR family transcriptional regulator
MEDSTRGAGNLAIEEAPPLVAPTDPVAVAAEHWRSRGWPAGPHFLAALSILRVETLIRQSNELALKPHRLTHSRHEALAVLYFSRNGEMPLGKLSQRLLVHPTSVTSTIDALERLRLVERVPHPTDRRATLARITAKGRTAIEQSCEAIAHARSGLHTLTDHQANTLYGLLAKVRKAAGDLPTVDTADGASGQAVDPVAVAAEHWRSRGWPAGPHFLAALSILRVETLIRQSNELALKPHRLTHSRHEALAVLYFSRNGEMPLGKLSQRLLVHPTSVTSTIDALERLRLVERVPHPTDRRATLARITAKGRTAIEQSCEAIAHARSGLHTLTDHQANTLYGLLAKVRKAAGDLP